MSRDSIPGSWQKWNRVYLPVVTHTITHRSSNTMRQYLTTMPARLSSGWSLRTILTRDFSIIPTARSIGTFIRPVPLNQLPETALEPLEPAPSPSSTTTNTTADPIQHLIALRESNELPPNIRIQDWVDDRKRWQGISKDERDGKREKGGRGTGRPFGKGKWIIKGLRDLLQER